MLLALTLNIFISAILILSFSHRLGRNGTCAIILTFNIICIFLIIIQTFYTTTVLSEIQYSFYNEKSFFINFEWGFSLDIISLFFMFIILFITTAVLCFACSHMYTDIRFTFFISFLQFFMFFMLILVLSKNIIQLFIGWEGVGIISFLSINFWYLRLNSNKASLKALIFNRIGDFGYIGFVVICVGLFKTTTITLLPFLINQNVFYEQTTFIVLFIVLAIFGKSAQLVLYAWLPDAMEGPTPVSALLHSATMVTAGVYLFLRLADIVYNSSIIWIYSILIIGGITSIFCGLYALVKFDIKKIIAFSTCSQLGLMFCTIALGFTFPAFYHLFIHAFFKALLFISSGIIIHALADEQDIRIYGLNSLYTPFYHLALFIGSINIMGIFFVSGFYSKETLLITSVFSFSYVFKSFVLISSIFTIMYSIRLFFYSNGVVRNTRVLLKNNHSLDGFFIYAVCSLSLMSIFIGFYFVDIFNGLGTNQCFIISIPYNTINFELAPNSIIFLFPIFIIGFFIFYKTKINFFQKKTINNFTFNSFINTSIIEFSIQSFYWSLNEMFNFIVYNYIIKINERGILDNLSLLGLIKISSMFHFKLNNFLKTNFISLILSILIILSLLVFNILILNPLNFSLYILYTILIFISSLN